eukprot:8091877-Pyramimonas_sp.AAC.1
MAVNPSASRGTLEALLGSRRCRPGRLGTVLGRLGRLLGDLGAVLDRLGRLLGLSSLGLSSEAPGL